MRCAILGVSTITPAACGGSGAGDGDQSAGFGSLSAGISDTGATDEPADASGDADASGSATSQGPSATTDGPADTDTDADTDGGGAVFDVGIPDGGDVACNGPGGGGDRPGGDGDGLLSYIWVANSGQGTVSKINTETMVEEGRYIVRADAMGSPSRTSVNLNGDVVIANRNGGVTMIYARPENCVESNGTPGIQTSVGAAPLAWGEEECIAWHTPLACTSNRPVAWTKGTFDEATCRWDDTKVWTECWNWPTAEVLLLDGETGVIEQSVPIPGANQRIYGGAVDGEGNFWGNQDTTALVRVDREDFSVQTWGVPEGLPSYGIAIDLEGRPWLCGGGGAARFDIETETFQALPSSGFSQIGGCMVDANGILWHGRFHEAVLLGIDTETVEFVSEFAIPAYVHGVSIDFAGNVWGVGFGSTEAYRVDPVTGQVDTFAGLVGAYSYSDMTGFALSSAGTPAG